MDMNGKTKFLILGLLLAAVLNIFLSSFWSFAICALSRVVASGVVPLFVLSKFGAGITSIRFLL